MYLDKDTEQLSCSLSPDSVLHVNMMILSFREAGDHMRWVRFLVAVCGLADTQNSLRSEIWEITHPLTQTHKYTRLRIHHANQAERQRAAEKEADEEEEEDEGEKKRKTQLLDNEYVKARMKVKVRRRVRWA